MTNSSNDEKWQGHIRLLLYFVMFESSPLDWVDEAVEKLIEGNTQGIAVQTFYLGIIAALDSTVELRQLLPNFRPSEAVTRNYLRALKEAIEERHNIGAVQSH